MVAITATIGEPARASFTGGYDMKTFTAKQRARLTPIIVERVREDCTIGAVERLAGIPRDNASRLAFWRTFLPIDRAHGIQACIDAAMAECRRRIAEQTDWVML